MATVPGRSRSVTAGLLAAHMIEVPHFIMERRMMLNLKERAERRWRAGAGARAKIGR